MIASVASLWLLVHHPSTGVIAFIFSGILLPLVVGIDGFCLAKHLGEVELQKYQRWYVYSAYCIITLFLILPGFKDVVRKYCAASYETANDGMHPTMRKGDLVLYVRPMLIGQNFRRGDVIMRASDGEGETLEPGRIVALSGETIEIKNRMVFIDEKPLCEPYATWQSGEGQDFGPSHVPAGTVFVLGDNRPKASDSRTWKNPFLPVPEIAGRARLIFWNTNGELANLSKEFDPPPDFQRACQSSAP